MQGEGEEVGEGGIVSVFVYTSVNGELLCVPARVHALGVCVCKGAWAGVCARERGLVCVRALTCVSREHEDRNG